MRKLESESFKNAGHKMPKTTSWYIAQQLTSFTGHWIPRIKHGVETPFTRHLSMVFIYEKQNRSKLYKIHKINFNLRKLDYHDVLLIFLKCFLSVFYSIWSWNFKLKFLYLLYNILKISIIISLKYRKKVLTNREISTIILLRLIALEVEFKYRLSLLV